MGFLFRFAIAAAAATIFAVLVFALSCSTAKESAGKANIAGNLPELSPPPEFSAPEYTERTIGEVLAEIREFQVPDGADEGVFSMLKAELERQIIELYGEGGAVRIASAAPIGGAGFAGDLALDADTGELVWSYANIGDYDLNGEVGISDITPIALNYLKKAIEPGSIEAWIDGDGDGEIGVPDVTPIAMHYLNTVSQYRVYSSDSPDGGFEDSGVFIPFGQTGEFPKEYSFPISGFTERYFAVYPFAPGEGLELIPGERSRVIDSLAPVPEIASVDPIYGSSGFSAVFSAETADEEPLEFNWDFGGGAVPNSSRSTNPEVMLAEKGKYPATLIVSNGHIRKKFTFDLTVVERDGEVVSAWPMYGRDARNTRRSPYKGPDTPELKWKFRTFGPGEPIYNYQMFGSYTADPDGTIYASLSAGSEFVAINPDGTLKWTYPVSGQSYVMPVIGNNGTIYGGDYFSVFAFSTDGLLEWKFEMGYETFFAFCADANGGLYVVDSIGNLTSLSSLGSLNWRVSYDGVIATMPALMPDNKAVFGTMNDNAFHAYSGDGVEVWRFDVATRPAANLIDGNSGKVFCADQFTLYCLSSNGQQIWHREVNDALTGGGVYLALSDNGILYCSSKTALLAFDLDGNELWRREIEDGLRIYRMIVRNDGSIVADRIKSVSLLNSDGIELWRKDVEKHVSGAPTLGKNGNIIYSAGSAKLECIDNSGQLLWSILPGGMLNSYCLLGKNSEVFLAAGDANLYIIREGIATILSNKYINYPPHFSFALHPEGQMIALILGFIESYDYAGNLKWKSDGPHPYAGSPIVGADGKIYVSFGDAISAMDVGGNILWSNPIGRCGRSVSIAYDGTIYYGDIYGRTINALRYNGNAKWSYDLGYELRNISNIVIGDDGSLRFSALYGQNDSTKIYVLNPDGTEKWTKGIENVSILDLALGFEGRFYGGGTDGALYAFDDDGDIVWKFQSGAPVFYPPVVDSEESVYFGSVDKSIYALDKDGNVKWSYKTLSGIGFAPSIGEDGTVYVGGSDGYLYAIGPSG